MQWVNRGKMPLLYMPSESHSVRALNSRAAGWTQVQVQGLWTTTSAAESVEQTLLAQLDLLLVHGASPSVSLPCSPSPPPFTCCVGNLLLFWPFMHLPSLLLALESDSFQSQLGTRTANISLTFCDFKLFTEPSLALGPCKRRITVNLPHGALMRV